jgi:cell division transport system permease protein
VALSYTVKEGLSGFRRAKFAALTATSALMITLVLMGVFGLLLYQGQQVSDWLRQRVGEIQVFINDPAAAETVRNRLLAQPAVREVEYISPQQAAEEFRQSFGEEADLFPGETFLPASFRVRVTPAYANADSLQRLAADVQTWSRVDEVFFNQALLMRVQHNLRILTGVGLALGVLVLLAALFLVGNTIRLTIYARRMLIRTMKLVGATNQFIRRPFLIEGLAQGFVAGVAACFALWLAYGVLTSLLPEMEVHAWPAGTPATVFALILLTGLLLGWLGSYVAVRRFITEVRLS